LEVIALHMIIILASKMLDSYAMILDN